MSSVSPLSVTLNELTTFTVTGSDLPSSLAFFIEDCETVRSTGGTSSSRSFTCTPSSTAGSKGGQVKDQAGGELLFSFNVQVADATPEPSVSSVSPLSATLNEETTFTVSGSNLPTTTAFFIEDCENVRSAGGTSSSRRFTCTPSGTIGMKSGNIKETAGSNNIFEFEVRTTAELPRVTISDFFPLQAKIGDKTTFTITGANLPDTTSISFPDCSGLEFISRSILRQQLTCTPQGNLGLKTVSISASENSGELVTKTFQVDFEEASREPVVSVSSTPVIEGSQLVFLFDLDYNPTFSEVTVKYQINGGTATEGSDFAEHLGIRELSLRGDSEQKSVRIQTLGDGIVESDETIRLEIVSVDGGVSSQEVYLGTILDDDVAGQKPSLYLSRFINFSPTEGEEFTYRLSGTISNLSSDTIMEWTIQGDIDLEDIVSINVRDLAENQFGDENFRDTIYTDVRNVRMRIPSSHTSDGKIYRVTIVTRDDDLMEPDELVWMSGELVQGNAVFEERNASFSNVIITDND